MCQMLGATSSSYANDRNRFEVELNGCIEFALVSVEFKMELVKLRV